MQCVSLFMICRDTLWLDIDSVGFLFFNLNDEVALGMLTIKDSLSELGYPT